MMQGDGAVVMGGRQLQGVIVCVECGQGILVGDNGLLKLAVAFEQFAERMQGGPQLMQDEHPVFRRLFPCPDQQGTGVGIYRDLQWLCGFKQPAERLIGRAQVILRSRPFLGRAFLIELLQCPAETQDGPFEQGCIPALLPQRGQDVTEIVLLLRPGQRLPGAAVSVC